jgi:hypothetical protein
MIPMSYGEGLRLHPEVSIADGGLLIAEGGLLAGERNPTTHPFLYSVAGLPLGETVLIREQHDGRWKKRRNRGAWEGDYATPQAALDSLQHSGGPGSTRP